jgi:hypothetical protein
MQPALIITGTDSSNEIIYLHMAPQGHREPSVNPLTGITIEVKTLDNTIPTPSPSFHHYAITHK